MSSHSASHRQTQAVDLLDEWRSKTHDPVEGLKRRSVKRWLLREAFPRESQGYPLHSFGKPFFFGDKYPFPVAFGSSEERRTRKARVATWSGRTTTGGGPDSILERRRSQQRPTSGERPRSTATGVGPEPCRTGPLCAGELCESGQGLATGRL